MSARDDLERLYREQGARLWRAVFLYTHDADVASDAVAEAFARPCGGSRLASATAVPAGAPEDAMDLVRALQKLSPKQRAAFVLHHYAGYPHAEVARVIGSTTAAVACCELWQPTG